MMRVSRRGLVPPFIAMDVLRAANERELAGGNVVHLELGQPGSSAPEPVLEAARRALARERIGYTDALGIAPLRHAIAAHYQAQYGVAVDLAGIGEQVGVRLIMRILASLDRDRLNIESSQDIAIGRVAGNGEGDPIARLEGGEEAS